MRDVIVAMLSAVGLYYHLFERVIPRLLARYGADASLRDIMHEQIGSCPHDTQLYTRCDPYCPTLARLFSPYGEVP